MFVVYANIFKHNKFFTTRIYGIYLSNDAANHKVEQITHDFQEISIPDVYINPFIAYIENFNN